MSQRSSLGGSSASGSPAAPPGPPRLGLARPALAPRKSLIALRQSIGPPTASSPSPSHTSGFATPPLPTHPPLLTAITPKRTSLAHSHPQTLDIGDLVSVTTTGETFTGVLRHLGPVHFKEGNYAGLELVGDSFGKGKNNGAVQGQQYFATQPNNGMFCLASKVVKLSQGPATDAVARPESALSQQSGSQNSHSRSASFASQADRPRSRVSNSIGPTATTAYTPVRSNIRQRSNTASSYQRSESSSRPTSRASGHHERTASDTTGVTQASLSTPGHMTRGANVSSSSATSASGIPGKLRTPSASAASVSGSKLPFSGRKSFGFGGVQRASTPAAGASAAGIPPVPRPPSASQRSRASSRASSTLEDEQVEADSERRAKTSAEAAARAEQMISVGSRAHRFLGMRARDLNGSTSTSSSSKEAADEVFGGSAAKQRTSASSASGVAPPTSPSKPASPSKGRPSSPLKATLLGRPSLGGGSNNTPTATTGGLEALRKARVSMPTVAASSSSGSINATPRPPKGRQSLFSQNSEAMPPPPSPGKLSGLVRSFSAAQGTGSPTRSTGPGLSLGLGQGAGPNANGNGNGNGSERPASAASTDGARSNTSRLGVHSALAGSGPLTPVKGSSGGSLLISPTRRPSLRPSLGSSSTSGSYMTAVDEGTGPSSKGGDSAGDTSFVRRHRLLEEMDLTPKRPGQASSALDESPRSSSRLSAAGDSSRLASASASELGSEFVAQASVPLSLYEEAQQDIERLTASLTEAERKAVTERSVRTEEDRVLRAALDSERARVKEDKEEWEEERRLSRADEERRKRDAENRERELKESIAQLKRDLESSKELPREVEALKAELGERDRLADELKRAIEERDQGKAEESGKVRIVEAEMHRAEEKLKRVEADHRSEVKALQREIDDLKAAGTEMLQLFDSQAEELRGELREQIENDYREDMRKTLRDLAAVEAERDALVYKREAEDAERSLANGRGVNTANMAPTAITIENESLREQLSHLQEKVGSLEEELALAHVQSETDREAVQNKSQRAAEKEANLQAEIKKLKSDLERVNKEARAARQRIDDLNDVVEESKTALETERAEVERLRADLLSSSGLAAPQSGSDGGPKTSTLQDEAMQERAKRAEAEKAKSDAEVERLTRLLDGARSGKKEAVRMVEELRKSVEEKVDLIEDVRRELSSAEAERASLERKVAQGTRGGPETEGSAVLVRSLRRTIDDRIKEVEMLKRTHMPLSDQLLELRKIHSEEITNKDEELRRLRTSLAAAKASAKKLSDGPIVERRALSPVVGQQAHSNGGGDGIHSYGGKEDGRPLSMISVASRTSRNSVADLHLPDNHMVANQVSGLNYLVRQLTDENAKVKSQFRLLEQQSKEEVEEAKSEARVSALTLESLRQDVVSLKSGDNQAFDLIQLRTEFSQQTASLEKQIQDARAEITRLQAANKQTDTAQKQTLDAQAKEISDLEHLVESQIYKLDEKQEMYERLDRRLERSNAIIEELRVQLDSAKSLSQQSPGTAAGASTPSRKASESESQGTAREEEDSPSQTHALRLRKTSVASNSSGLDTLGRLAFSNSTAQSTPSSTVSDLPSTTPTAAPTATSSKPSFALSSSVARNYDSCDEDEDDDDDDELENFCVLCNMPGHSVVNCDNDLVRPASAGSARRGFEDGDDACDDCGERGHKLEDCPYADVF
ncbi:unnamed protein product [Tilletia laevis]|uniref:CAP-Gly domain-containing protein n=2 Tax=Tilletia TaxID=13289 RepID=A0A177VF02_9BASI|nr:hypothetical protein CF336_g4554 [Tilletia laevis]KAE8264522.1 hypothetical protein A4X03_0g883 [Tilletia caries]CAD6890369.1 unnamed protein product [Tilletia caries]CAD6911593.1 unnamed protein product [Tilletia caries]CAD6930899.1 unnamed protein product [Tilletia laevis]